MPRPRAILTAALKKENVSKENEANCQARDEELNKHTSGPENNFPEFSLSKDLIFLVLLGPYNEFLPVRSKETL